MNNAKLKIVKRSLKHTFTPDEIAKLNVSFGQSFDSLQAAESDKKSVVTQYTAKVQEAESRMISIRSTINAGFEMRDKELAVILDVKAGKKYFLLKEQAESEIDGLNEENSAFKYVYAATHAVITEPITEADLQAELIESESKFDARQEIELFKPAGQDSGILVVGRQGGKWFSALRVKIGTREIKERLDSEQACSKKRPDQIKRACKRFCEWVDENLGHEEAKGFKNSVALVQAEHAEREE